MSRYGLRSRLTGAANANTINYWFGGGFVEPPQPSGGNETKTVGSYRYHFFTANGTLVVPESKTIEVCSIGGGGGGGNFHGGGGGGAEVDYWTSVSATANNYDVVVGAKGNGGISSTSTNATQGGTSKFSLGVTDYVTSLGGGRGGSGNGTAAGGSGGSGGGGSGITDGTAGGTASGSNTFAGGVSSRVDNNLSGAGGGGATVAGANGVSGAASSVGGAGGEGLTLTTIDSNLTAANFTTLTGMTVISSGGGGSTWTDPDATETTGLGGTGAGNGGNGRGGTSPTASTSYGSGGGAGSSTGSSLDGTDGFAGLVIVRYAV